MSDRLATQKPPQRKTKTIVLTVMGAAAVGVLGFALLGGKDEATEELRRNAYKTKEDCVADYSEAQCEPQQLQGQQAAAGGQQTASSGSSALAWIGPAYLAGRMMGGGGFGGASGFAGAPGAAGPVPGQREEQRSGGGGGGGYYRPGAAVNDPGPGRTQGTAAAVPRMAVSNVSRGGFGSTGRSFSSSSSS